MHERVNHMREWILLRSTVHVWTNLITKHFKPIKLNLEIHFDFSETFDCQRWLASISSCGEVITFLHDFGFNLCCRFYFRFCSSGSRREPSDLFKLSALCKTRNTRKPLFEYIRILRYLQCSCGKIFSQDWNDAGLITERDFHSHISTCFNVSNSLKA